MCFSELNKPNEWCSKWSPQTSNNITTWKLIRNAHFLAPPDPPNQKSSGASDAWKSLKPMELSWVDHATQCKLPNEHSIKVRHYYCQISVGFSLLIYFMYMSTHLFYSSSISEMLLDFADLCLLRRHTVTLLEAPGLPHSSCHLDLWTCPSLSACLQFLMLSGSRTDLIALRLGSLCFPQYLSSMTLADKYQKTHVHLQDSFWKPSQPSFLNIQGMDCLGLSCLCPSANCHSPIISQLRPSINLETGQGALRGEEKTKRHT